MILDIHVDFPIIFDIYVKFLGVFPQNPNVYLSFIVGSADLIVSCVVSVYLISKVTKVCDVMPGSGWGLDVEKICIFGGEGEPNRVHRVGCSFQGRIPYRLASFLIGHQEIRGIPSIYPPPRNSQHQIIIFLVRDSLKSFICTLLLGGGVDPRDTDCIGFCWDSPVNFRFLGVKGVRHFGWWVIMMASEWIAKESNCTNRIKTVFLL